MAHPPLLVVVGPTGAGKSAAVMTLCEHIGGELVSADSVQVYRGADIGSAKPSAAEQARVPHHCIDLVTPGQQLDAATWVAHADRAIEDVRARDRVPIVCGGTGFYVRALLKGLSPIPAIDEALRSEVRELLRTRGPQAMHAELAQVDPEASARISPGDPQRISRALEVYRQTGKTLSAWQSEHRFADTRHEARVVGWWPEREQLYARINARVPRMLAAGWREEVAKMLAEHVPVDLPPLNALGYRQMVSHVKGDLSEPELLGAIQQAHRRYARRQLTWFRRVTARDHTMTRIDAGDAMAASELLRIATNNPSAR